MARATTQTLQIGKSGLSENFIEDLKKRFEKTENIRVSILKSTCKNKEDAKKIHDELLAILGKKFTGKLIGHTLILKKWRKIRA